MNALASVSRFRLWNSAGGFVELHRLVRLYWEANPGIWKEMQVVDLNGPADDRLLNESIEWIVWIRIRKAANSQQQYANSQRLLSSIRCGSVACEQALSTFRLYFVFIRMSIWLRKVNSWETNHPCITRSKSKYTRSDRVHNFRQRSLFPHSTHGLIQNWENMNTARFYIKALLIYWYPIRLRIQLMERLAHIHTFNYLQGVFTFKTT